MKYATVCSGIEAPSVAAHPLGWKPVWFSEIEPFPCKVLAHHYPDVPNLGDMTKITKEQMDELGPVDVLIGGTPCQSFSIAGLRQGLADPRGNLALEYLRIADALRPRWVVWENVPGVLSSNKGRDFESFLTALAELGYGFAYRVLDAQYFGVAQRRRRVFVVGCAGGDWQRAAQVLLERESLRGDSPQGLAQAEVVGAITTRTGVGRDNYSAEVGHCLIDGNGPRWPMPIECERLQGFPDDYTLIDGAKDTPRYKALGNSMAVPVMRWIFDRIEKSDTLPRR